MVAVLIFSIVGFVSQESLSEKNDGQEPSTIAVYLFSEPTKNAAGGVTTNEYYPNLVRGIELPGRGPLKKTINAMGFVHEFPRYDPSGQPLSEKDEEGHLSLYTYDQMGNRRTQTQERTLPNGSVEPLVTSWDYNNSSRITSVTNPDGSISRTEYNPLGQDGVRIDPLNRRTEFIYDDVGRLEVTKYAAGTQLEVTERTEYDAEGRRTASIDRAGRRTVYEYDPAGRLTKTILPGALPVFTLTEYDSASRAIARIDGRNNRTTFEYDSAGRRIAMINADGKTTRFGFDAVGNLVAETDALGRVTIHFYDSLDRETGVLFANGSTAFTDYDSLGRRTVATDQGGKVTRFEYDSLGRLVAVVDHDNRRTEYGYDEVGNQITQTDAENHITRFEYDKMGRRTKKILHDGRFEAWTFDLAGNQKTHRNLEGITTTFEHDDLNRMTAIIPDAAAAEPRIDYTYFVTGRRKTMRDGHGLTEYLYDERDRVAEIKSPNGVLTFTWDANSNLTGIETNRGTKMVYKYDSVNRLVEVDDPHFGKITYEWDDVGNLVKVKTPNGVEVSYAHDLLNRITNIQHKGNFGIIENLTYTLGPAGERRIETEQDGRTSTRTFDNVYRLTSDQISNAAISGATSYQYSNAHNRTVRTSTIPGITNQNFTHDATDQNNSFPHDAAGNIQTIGTRTYEYNSRNQIVKVSGPTGIWLYVYNGDGDMVAKGDGTETTYYLVIPGGANLTGFSQVVEELEGTNPQTATLKRFYCYGLQRVAKFDYTSTNLIVYYGTDVQGTVRFLSDPTGNKVAEYDYDGWGVLLSAIGPAANENVYRFHGERWDNDAALIYSRARWYSPDLGTWTSRDPFEGTVRDPRTFAPYSAMANNPVMFTDPSGQSFLLSQQIGNVISGIVDRIKIVANQVSIRILGRVATKFFTRPLTVGDMGIQGAVQTLRGTFSVIGRSQAVVRIEMLQGTIQNPFAIVNNLANLARAHGAITLRIEATLANPQLYQVLVSRYGLITEAGRDFFILIL